MGPITQKAPCKSQSFYFRGRILRQLLVLYATTVLYSPSSSVTWASELAANLGSTVANFRVGDGNAKRSGPAPHCAAPGAARARCDWAVISASPSSPSVCRLQMGSAFGLGCQISRHVGQQTDGGDSHTCSWWCQRWWAQISAPEAHNWGLVAQRQPCRQGDRARRTRSALLHPYTPPSQQQLKDEKYQFSASRIS